MISFEELRVAVLGLGYVGLPLAAEFGRHRPVVGFDIDERRILDLQKYEDRTLEMSKDELKEARYLTLTSDEKKLIDCNLYIITVHTPIYKNKRPDLTILMKASATVGKLLKKGDIVIYESTVYPGCTEDECVPQFEKYSGLKFNKDFFCGYPATYG